ncbi:hypothetical protein NOV72_05497 [Caballeronia novacaledonica]|uniref:Uncharacterized protein n=1 Tax=Caballeronia novacaledonica TaxID=1544861 RepID=A0A2U3IDM4_9BURK|nr:hypothetical protein NOV72_05497 [Caballeronia novacaledonica]
MLTLSTSGGSVPSAYPHARARIERASRTLDIAGTQS